MRDTAGILLDVAEPQLTAQIRDIAQRAGANIADLHVWRIGPHAHAVIVSISGAPGDAPAIRAQVHALPGVEHVTIERR
jgi:Co/Zn/Cd efflux system component